MTRGLQVDPVLEERRPLGAREGREGREAVHQGDSSRGGHPARLLAMAGGLGPVRLVPEGLEQEHRAEGVLLAGFHERLEVAREVSGRDPLHPGGGVGPVVPPGLPAQHEAAHQEQHAAPVHQGPHPVDPGIVRQHVPVVRQRGVAVVVAEGLHHHVGLQPQKLRAQEHQPLPGGIAGHPAVDDLEGLPRGPAQLLRLQQLGVGELAGVGVPLGRQHLRVPQDQDAPGPRRLGGLVILVEDADLGAPPPDAHDAHAVAQGQIRQGRVRLPEGDRVRHVELVGPRGSVETELPRSEEGDEEPEAAERQPPGPEPEAEEQPREQPHQQQQEHSLGDPHDQGIRGQVGHVPGHQLVRHRGLGALNQVRLDGLAIRRHRLRRSSRRRRDRPAAAQRALGRLFLGRLTPASGTAGVGRRDLPRGTSCARGPGRATGRAELSDTAPRVRAGERPFAAVIARPAIL